MNRIWWHDRFSHGSMLFLFLALALSGSLLTFSTEAAMVRSLDLDELSNQADRIFRGTVVRIERATAEVGGGEVPVVVYRLRVTEVFKGSFEQEDGQLIADLRMVTSPEGEGADGARPSQTFSFIPRLDLGGDYLLMVTRPSTAGLSTPVGLGQGYFTVDGPGNTARVRNGFGNAGLFGEEPLAAGQPTPADLTYGDLAERLNRSIQQSKRKEPAERVQR